MAVEPSSEKKTLAKRVRFWISRPGAIEFGGQQRGGFVGQAQGGGVGDFPKLPADGGVDRGMAMAVQIGPDGRIGVQVFAGPGRRAALRPGRKR